jgi:hypothetical protein
LPEHIQAVLGAAAGNDTVARRFANGFSDPNDLQHWLMDPAKTDAYLARVAGAQGAPQGCPAGPAAQTRSAWPTPRRTATVAPIAALEVEPR